MTLLASSVFFRCDFGLPNPVLRTNGFFYNYVVLTELEEIHIGSDL
jgi:hypothetical protein